MRKSFFSDRSFKFLLGGLVFLFLLITIQGAYTQPPPPPPPTYTLTDHGNSTSGVNRNTGSLTGGLPYPDASPYAVGHCGHCHEMHASIGGNEPPPTGDFENLYSLFKENYGANRNEICYACHETFNFTGTPDPPLGYGRYYCYSGKTNYAGPTNNSTHNTSGSMTWPLTPPPGPTYLDAGNCDNCHNPHGYRDATGVIPSMLFKREETLCNECHDGSPALKDIKTRVTTDTYRHNVGGYSGVHLAGNQETSAYISANKHVECVDCHNPHMAGTTIHTRGTNVVSNLIKGVLGAVTTFSGTNWTAPTSYTLGIATKEYEICFKCHAGYNTNVTSWGGAGAAAWTNVGLEFSTGNKSIHPVTVGLNSLTNSPAPKALTAAVMVAPWATAANLGVQTMYCSDCHNYTAASPAGPHGSAVKWMLSGTNRAWPYTTTAGNGTSTGTYWTLSNYSTGTAPNTLFCRNCHTIKPSTGKNDVHAESDHNSYKCVNCHIRVPHGGKVSRLINADNLGTGLPARYYPDGAGGGGLGTDRLKLFIKRSPTSYSVGDCNASCYTKMGGHDASTGETW